LELLLRKWTVFYMISGSNWGSLILGESYYFSLYEPYCAVKEFCFLDHFT